MAHMTYLGASPFALYLTAVWGIHANEGGEESLTEIVSKT